MSPKNYSCSAQLCVFINTNYTIQHIRLRGTIYIYYVIVHKVHTQKRNRN